MALAAADGIERNIREKLRHGFACGGFPAVNRAVCFETAQSSGIRLDLLKTLNLYDRIKQIIIGIRSK